MKLRNSIGIETRIGYKLFELYEGDSTDSSILADLLVVSSYAGSYLPTSGSLIGSLYETWGLDLSNVKVDFDLRAPLSVWISEELTVGNYSRILCVDIVGSKTNLESALSNIFASIGILEVKGVAPKSMVLPLIGTGQQYLNPETIVAILIPEALNALQRLSTLEKIIFIDIDASKVNALDEAINEYLGRSNVLLPKDDLISNLQSDICSLLDKSYPSAPFMQKSLYEDMRRLLSLEEVRSFEVGILARRFVESMVNFILPSNKPVHNLAKGIDLTAQYKIAPWIRSYMHTLRLIGNESAHEKSTEGRRPPFVGEDDLVLTLFCIQRLLIFGKNLE